MIEARIFTVNKRGFGPSVFSHYASVFGAAWFLGDDEEDEWFVIQWSPRMGPIAIALDIDVAVLWPTLYEIVSCDMQELAPMTEFEALSFLAAGHDCRVPPCMS